MKLNKPYTNKDYADFANYCNENNYIIIDKGSYLESSESSPINPTLEEQLIELETKYNMPRVIREGILGNPAMYSEFNVNRAKELEAIAEKIRQLKEGK